MSSSLVKCLECSLEFKFITNRHLAKHNLTSKDYLAKYPGSRLSSQEYREKLRSKMLGREITWKDKISEGTKLGMLKPESWEKFMAHVNSRDNSHMAERFKSHLPEVKDKMYTPERNDKVSKGKKSWWADGRKGKTVEELYGEDMGKRIRRIKSEQTTGEKNPAFGKLYDNTGRKVGRYKGKFFRSVFEYYYYKHLESLGIDLNEVEYEPLTIKYKLRGKARTYHPDFLVKPLKLLVEVKSNYALNVRKKGRKTIEAKKIAAESFCNDNGLTYVILTEEDFPVRSYQLAYDDPDVIWIKK